MMPTRNGNSSATGARTLSDDTPEAADRLSALASANESIGVIGSFDKRLNHSVMSLGAKVKEQKVLGGDPQPRLASLYLVSGLGKDPLQWALSDKDMTLGVQPIEDSLGMFWRPDMLGNTFSGEKSDEFNKNGKPAARSSSAARRDIQSKTVPGAGPEGASRLVARTMKFAHPRDVEVVNSALAPPTTCHTFSFNVSRQSTLTAIAAQASRGNKFGLPPESYMAVSSEQPSAAPAPGQEHLRGTTHGSDLVFYGVTLTVWSHADKERAIRLSQFKQRSQRLRNESATSESIKKDALRRRGKTPWIQPKKGVTSDYTASDTGFSDSDLETTFTSTYDADYSADGMSAAYGEATDVFWLPYALTLVSRYPIYDAMQDYLRLSWARYSKDARAHMRQVFTLLNSDAPRPGDLFSLPLGTSADEEVAIEAIMPGAIDFEKGTTKVDFQMWPLFQALDLDHILTCVEVALTSSGRIVFCSRYPAMLGSAVETLKYIVELRGWDGIALQNIHLRDVTFMIEDPGPYIIGLSTECRYTVSPPNEVVIVDLDQNTLTCKSRPASISTGHKRDKQRHKLVAAMGSAFPSERSVPFEFRVSFLKGSFRNINRIHHGPTRPRYLGERLEPPAWWNQSSVVAVFDKILADRHKKPTLFQRLTKTGNARVQEQLTVNEQMAKAMMRKRALHYVEKRDDFELKVARITRRLQKLMLEGEHWKQKFEMFEKYAERLTQESNDLKGKIDKEQREARRLSNINTEQTKINAELQEKLGQTEGARAEAMRQLSDMHHSIQELERERNDIMDAIEMQLTTAMERMPWGDHIDNHSLNGLESPPTSPKTVASVSTIKRKSRPNTRDSIQTVGTIDSYAHSKKAISIIGALNDGPARRGLGSIVDSDQVSNTDRLASHNRLESISQRVAMIQAKLEIALAPIRDQVEAAEQEGAETEKDEEKDQGSRPGTPDTITTAKLPTINEPEGEGTPRKGEHSDDLAAPVTDTDNTEDAEPSKPPVLRAFVLRPPPRRVVQKRSYESIKAPDSAIAPSPVSTAHSISEIIVTPYESKESLHHDKGLDVKTTKERPTSVGTIAFGTA
ncbi:uncharacterized protein CcaverHIS019_0204760 [Cutaneotrichosporon cavernicola]|uniref:UDENN domain-containing protein n=1 Tax=Cutaneotrichosporon cavernicola TaxID=279322 RepID=A0AA48I3T9_9TREE|nr:uncharacterized protein CcaverHIS019_0204760 [Cutaneotrichosporon cavernicola]BEI89114.1 hypothetical protein CcaverHIS019_0204760 [Cutaneotrichosporon cavernicola]BEJ04662.1 hypothetical protein CcaverHIS641_0204790 [Cutaneotrichosporon cavernicola]